MLHLTPAPLHRRLLRAAHGLRRTWWRLRRPHIAGCRVIALDRDGRVLLVRHAYGKDAWYTPGGGLRRGEDPVAAALRELREETGCNLQAAREVEALVEPLHGARNHVHVVVGRTDDMPHADRREILEAAFFAPDALPGYMPTHLAKRLPGWIESYNKLS